MAILINRTTQVLIQGITGKVGSFQAQIMKEYGTKIVAGVTPGKGSTEVFGIPVYDLVEEAAARHRIDAAFSFVPARFAREAADLPAFGQHRRCGGSDRLPQPSAARPPSDLTQPAVALLDQI